MTSPTIVLVGPLGSGRTSVGAALSERLGIDLVETEDLVSRELGLPFDEAVLSASPDELSRTIEREALRQLGRDGSDRVVTLLPSAATGSVIAATAEAGAPTVWLTASLAELARRSGLNAPRAAGLGQPRAMFAQMVRQLEESYAPLSPVEFSTEARSAQSVAIEIIGHFALQ